MNYKD